ncbi:DUF4164 family protein [Thalassospira lucentensis]|uniref:DUF4164 family protein n=1 Tax=Thalassospira lucentensis TaxID=168935 RepID=UPI00142E1060|nr:DUF4164 family protein [Thalassospira lucentensis]NIZ03631.1 DUF4164 family protein [Thalassospira lucentensis]
MSRLQQASDRLKTALDSLENAVESAVVKDADKQSSDVQEVEALRSQLSALRADYDKLTQTTETVSARLDGAVDQLKLVLAEDPVKEQA